MIYAAKNKVIDARLGTKQVLKMMLGDVLLYELPVYAVTCTFDNVTSNAPATVEIGGSLSVTLSGTGSNKVQANSVVVMMGETDVTSSVYDHSTKTITIASVTGDVSITAVGRPYDAEVEWLQSSGTQYINTGIKPKKTFTFDCKIAMLESNYNCVFWGCRSSGDTGTVGRQCYLNLNTNQYGDGILHLFTTKITEPTNWSSGAGMTIGTMYTYTGITCSSEMYDMTYPITLFAFNTIGTINTSVGICRIGGWVAYSNGIKVMDLIPVKNNNVGYMYDKVSGQLFGNAGSGAFTYGNDV